MSEWRAHFTTEWKLLLRGAHFRILMLVGVVHAWLVHRANEWTEHAGYYLHQFEFMYLGAITILAILSGVYGARSRQAAGEAQLIGSLPYHSIRRWSAQLTVFLFPFFIFTCVPVFIYLWLRETMYPGASLYPAWFLLSTFIPMLYAMILGWLLGGLFKSKIGYAAGFLLFFLHIYGGLLLLTPRLPMPTRLLPNFLLFDFKSMGYFDDQFGFSREMSFWTHRGFYLFLAFALFILFIYIKAKARREPGVRMQATGLILAACLAAGLLAGHVSQKTVQMNQVAIKEISNLESVKPARLSGLSYDLDMRPYKDGGLAVIATIQFTNEEAATFPLAFTLNERFEMTEARLNSESVRFSRDGNQIQIETGDIRPVTLVLHYRGKIADHKVTEEGTMTAVHMADRWNVNLPMELAWLPQPLFTEGAAPSRVTVRYPDTIRLYSNYRTLEKTTNAGVQTIQFEASNEAESGFNLWGGSLKEVAAETGGMTTKAIVNELFNDDYVSRWVALFHEGKRLMLQLNPEVQVREADTLIAMDRIRFNQREIAKTGSGIIQVPSYFFQGLYDDEEVVAQIAEFWFDSSGAKGERADPGKRKQFIRELSAYLIKLDNKKLLAANAGDRHVQELRDNDLGEES